MNYAVKKMVATCRPWVVGMLVLGCLAIGCSALPVSRISEPAPGFDATPRLAILSAFEPELLKLKKATQVKEVRILNGRTCYIGRLEGQDVVLLLSGVSMVNAALTTQALLDHFTVREIVFSGIAGGVNPELHVGDVTVPAAWGEPLMVGRMSDTLVTPLPVALVGVRLVLVNTRYRFT